MPAIPKGGASFIGNQAFAVADDVVFAETEAFVEGDGSGVVCADLEIDLRAASRFQELFGGGHEFAAVSLLLYVGVDGQVVDPPAVSVVASHQRCDQPVADHSDEEPVPLHLLLAGDVFAGVVPRPRQSAAFPQFDDSGFVRGLVGANGQHAGTSEGLQRGIHVMNVVVALEISVLMMGDASAFRLRAVVHAESEEGDRDECVTCGDPPAAITQGSLGHFAVEEQEVDDVPFHNITVR